MTAAIADGQETASGIRARDLTVTIDGHQALRGASFDAPRGALALVGNNGAGKSTLLRVLATLQPAEGQITIAGCDITTWQGVRAARRTLGYLSSDPAAPSAHTVEDASLYGAWLARLPRAARAAAVDRAIEQVGLTDRRADRLTALSTGMRRRAFLAQALVHEPYVLLLDEPTAGLDPDQRTEVRRIVRRVAAGRLVVFSTHLAEDVEHGADHVLVVRAGAIAWAGPAADFLAMGRQAAGGTDDGTLEAALRACDPQDTER